MRTELLFRDDPMLDTCAAKIVDVDAGGIRLDRTVFYAAGGGQPGDSGVLRFGGAVVRIVDTVKGEAPDDILHRTDEAAAPLSPGTEVQAVLDWERRHRHMRMHTALHLLCASVSGDVTGGQIAADRGRLDFNVPAGALDRDAIAERINALIAAAHPVEQLWITDAELAERPELVRTMSVRPPTGYGSVRLVRIGPADAPIDLQPCGGTHVGNTRDIGRIEIMKIENKGKQNRRVAITFAG